MTLGEFKRARKEKAMSEKIKYWRCLRATQIPGSACTFKVGAVYEAIDAYPIHGVAPYVLWGDVENQNQNQFEPWQPRVNDYVRKGDRIGCIRYQNNTPSDTRNAGDWVIQPLAGDQLPVGSYSGEVWRDMAPVLDRAPFSNSENVSEKYKTKNYYKFTIGKAPIGKPPLISEPRIKPGEEFMRLADVEFEKEPTAVPVLGGISEDVGRAGVAGGSFTHPKYGVIIQATDRGANWPQRSCAKVGDYLTLIAPSPDDKFQPEGDHAKAAGKTLELRGWNEEGTLRFWMGFFSVPHWPARLCKLATGDAGATESARNLPGRNLSPDITDWIREQFRSEKFRPGSYTNGNVSLGISAESENLTWRLDVHLGSAAHIMKFSPKNGPEALIALVETLILSGGRDVDKKQDVKGCTPAAVAIPDYIGASDRHTEAMLKRRAEAEHIEFRDKLCRIKDEQGEIESAMLRRIKKPKFEPKPIRPVKTGIYPYEQENLR